MKKKVVILIIGLVIIGRVLFLEYQIRYLASSNQKNYQTKIKNYEKIISEYQEEINKKPKKEISGGTLNTEELENLDLDGYDKLMISTHPDDESFWGGGHLLEDKYLVVCVTCGMDDNREQEFINVMNYTNSKYLMLTYPRVVDKNLNREFNWEAAGYLTQDLENIINLKDWNEIVTHNPNGEYGHKYHKLTSEIVTSIVKDKSKLTYFGRYYSNTDINNLSTDTLDLEVYNKKMDMINKYYISQRGSVTKHGHMFHNENFIKYENWS